MSRVWHKPAILLMWLSLPSAAWLYWRVWNQLAARVAVHFDVNWQPNGYTSREGAVQVGLEILVVMLVLFTLVTVIIGALKPVAFWPALVISYAVLGFCWYGNYSIVRFNLKAHTEHSEWVFGGPNSRSSSAGSHASRWLRPSAVVTEN